MALRLALRRLLHEPAFAAVAILTLAVGLGANAAIFSIVDGALLRPLAFPHPEQLVALDQSIPEFAQKYPFFPVNAASFHAWQQNSRLLQNVALLQPNNWVLSGSGEPLRVNGATVTASMFPTLGVEPRLGRNFLASEDRPGQNHVVILSDGFWRSQFHADPGVIGRTIDLDGSPHQIVGVLPASLQFPQSQELGPFFGTGPQEAMQLFEPAGIDYVKAPNVGNFNYFCIARMKPGVAAPQLRAELDTLTAGFLAATHAPAGIRVHTVVNSLRDQLVGSHALGLWMLLAAVGAILLIVCLNLANLLLVRVHGRAHEIAIRVALGASRGRLLGETVTEGVLLALLGGGLGVAAAAAALRALVHAAPAGIPRLAEVHVNAAVLGFSLLLALASGVLFSLWPALRSARTDPQTALRSGGRGASDSGRRLRARACLVAGQAALAALLLCVAGLLTASYLRLLEVNTGFQAGQVVEAELDWSAKSPQRAAFYHAVLAKAAALPGVRGAGLIDVIPTHGVNDTDLLSFVNDTRRLVDRPLAAFSAASPDYFNAMGIPLLRGRTFTAAEVAAVQAPVAKGGARAPVAAVISAATAEKIWPGKDALGQQFRQMDPAGPTFTVVGIVADVRAAGLDQPPGLQVYLPYTYNVPDGAALVLRTEAPLAALAPAIRQAVWSVEPAAAIPSIDGMNSVVSASVASRRFQLTLVVLFALCALFLAALGIYGVIAYSVERRANEIGLRMTLGAGAGDLVGMVMRQGLVPVVAGLVLGVGAALALGKVLASLLFGVHASDPAVLAVVSLAVLATGALACAVPARRATRMDPALTLRQG